MGASFEVGETVWALNPKYKDGTRLRAGPAADAGFNGVWVPNDTALAVLELAEGFARVRKPDEQEGWIRQRNLTHTERAAGVTRDVVTTEIVTPDPEYVKGIKIYGMGIKQDPVPGQKFGKGIQHLTSSHWLSAMSRFVATHLPQLQAFCRHARQGAAEHPGYDYTYFTNTANELFHRADAAGLRTREALDDFLMATWLVMAAAEVDAFPFPKYTDAERQAQREAFYALYEDPPPGPGVVSVGRDEAEVLGRFALPTARRDLLPPVALERLGINNELSSLKYADAEAPLRDGFLLSQRVDSLQRHFEGVHRRQTDEDHIIHLLWNFHAIYHVAVVMPEKNDLVDHSPSEPPKPTRYEPTSSRETIAQAGLEPAAVLKLDWNEGAIPPPPAVGQALAAYAQAAEGSYLKWYPHLAGGDDLRARLADYVGCIPENLLVTNGSDDGLILLCQTYLARGKTVLAPVPTYEHFCVNAAGTGAALVRRELADPFVHSAEELADGIEAERPDLVYLVSPNNPTGAEWEEAQVRGLASRYPDVLFVVDEAYYEFASAGTDGGPRTCARLATELANVVVTRTFSKAFCLASVRCGYLVAHPNTVEALRARYNPKSVNQFAQIAACHALDAVDDYYRPYVEATHTERARFVSLLRQRGVDVRGGAAGNFVCVRVPEGRTAELAARLEAEAIFVRDISGRFPGHVRVTIGLDMSRVADAICAGLTSMGLLSAERPAG